MNQVTLIYGYTHVHRLLIRACNVSLNHVYLVAYYTQIPDCSLSAIVNQVCLVAYYAKLVAATL